MGTLSSSPRTLRGAIVAVDPKSPLSRIVIFQYNPDEVRLCAASEDPSVWLMREVLHACRGQRYARAGG